MLAMFAITPFHIDAIFHTITFLHKSLSLTPIETLKLDPSILHATSTVVKTQLDGMHKYPFGSPGMGYRSIDSSLLVQFGCTTFVTSTQMRSTELFS